MGTESPEMANKQMLIEDSIGRRILDAAMEIINKEGYDGLTIRKVAKESGCSNSAIYMRFEDKSALAKAVAALHAKPFLIVMDESYVAEDNFFINMNRMTAAALKKVCEMDISSVHLQMYYRAGMLPEENPFVMKLESYIRAAAAKGEIHPGNVRNLAYSLEAGFWGIAYMLRNGLEKGMDLEQAKNMLKFHNNVQFDGIRIKNDEDMFWDTLKEKGVDVEKALERMKGNKEAYKNFLAEFFEDPDFETLKEALNEGNPRDAFEYAHGLKGMAANLGLEHVHECLSELVEILRPGNLTGAQEAYTKVMAACEMITVLL